MRSRQPPDAALRAWAAAHAGSVIAGETALRRAAAQVPWTPDAPIRTTAHKVRTIEIRSAISAAPTVLPDGGMLLPVSGFLDPTRIYGGDDGSVLHTLLDRRPPTSTGRYVHAACVVLPDGDVLLGTTSTSGNAYVWDARRGTLRRTLSGHEPGPLGVAWALPPDGRPLLAVISDRSGSVRVWDGRSGAALYTLANEDDARGYHRPVAWAVLASRRTLLTCGSPSGIVRTWDVRDRSVAHAFQHPEPVQGLDWAVPRDGAPMLATACDDHAVRIWDGHAGTCLFTLSGFASVSWRVRWAVLPDGRLLLAAGGRDRNLTVWNGRTGELLLTLDGQREVRDIAWAQLPDRSLRLITACADGVHVWQVDVDPPVPPPVPAAPGAAASPAPARSPGLRAADLSAGMSVVVACAGVGLWPPAGLVEDLIAVTGPGADPAALHDARIAVLAGSPGVRRLRELSWPRAARAAFAVLLVSGLPADARFAPPPEATPGDLRAALAEALEAGEAVPGPGTVSAAELATAAEGITPRVISLLAIIGPAAAAADPVMALRLAHLAGQLPELTRRQLEIISAGPRPRQLGTRAGTGAMVHSPGTAGVSRHGRLEQMLHTQLALPADLLAIRILRDQVLYRRHLGPVPPRPQPVTLVLDVTPPVFGAAEQVLRLVAHLITVALWERGQDPVLVSLAQPRAAAPLAGRAQLARLWVSRTLDSPAATMATALRTAARLPHPVVVLAHQHAHVPALAAGPGRLLITTRHPAEPDLPARGLTHLHLQPHPTETNLTEAVTFALTYDGTGRDS